MSNNRESFPSVSRLQQGSILGTIAHAIWVVQQPEFANEQSWDGVNYSIQDSEGCRGTITFAGKNIVGAFRDDNSSRSPWLSKEEYNINRFFKEIPSELLSIANNEALQYLLEEYEGIIQPVITAAFWSNGEYLYAAESWSKVVANGGSILRIQLMEIDVALKEWKSIYEMSFSQFNLMRSLIERKITIPNQSIVLSEDELNILLVNGNDGLDESRELLRGINIIVP